VGAFLSGGLDSSAVVAFAREKVPDIDCFTIAPDRQDKGDTSDLPYARRVAKHLGVPLHEVEIDSARMASDLEKMVYLLDEPLADPAALNVLYISQLARSQGIKVLLSGAGGDDLFTGYRRHRALAAERWWNWLPESARRGIRQGTAALGSRGVTSHGAGGSIARRIGKAFAHADQSADERLVGYFLWFDSLAIRGLFAAEHRSGLSSTSLAAPATEYLATLPRRLTPLERMLALEQRFFLGDHNLPYTDRMSMAAGVEVRVPFLDPDLLTLANSLPPALKQRGRHGKWVLKQAMRSLLPEDVIYRPKTGFGAPLRRWLRGELSEFVNDVLSPARLRRRGIFDAATVSDLVARDRNGQVDAAYPILALLCVELWCRHFVDGQAAYADHYRVPEIRGARHDDERPSQTPSGSRAPLAAVEPLRDRAKLPHSRGIGQRSLPTARNRAVVRLEATPIEPSTAAGGPIPNARRLPNH
jgi:asparagine synthase (glutamine-hydrolysing)